MRRNCYTIKRKFIFDFKFNHFMTKTYLSLGSNIGNRQENLAIAIAEIEKTIGAVLRLSPIYETESWGFDSYYFLNQVVEVSTSLDPHTLLSQCLETEKQMGRIRTNQEGYLPRIIDIDILLYDDLVLEERNLIIPHPRIKERKFILIPLNDIIPNYLHPVLQKTISQLLKDCRDGGEVRRFESV